MIVIINIIMSLLLTGRLGLTPTPIVATQLGPTSLDETRRLSVFMVLWGRGAICCHGVVLRGSGGGGVGWERAKDNMSFTLSEGQQSETRDQCCGW